MIRIDKGSVIPGVLSTGRGREATDKLCADFDLNPASFNKEGGVKFNAGIYSSQRVKNRLRKLQHNKCCFSEAKFTGDYGDVEHFRPKGRIGVENSNKKHYPGYYWLAYSWDNLFLCKELINRSHKKDLFPLLKEADRARNHNDDYSLEQPVLIDPSQEDPREHIEFHRDEPVGRTDRGKKTIALLNLRHSQFRESRMTVFKRLKCLKDALGELELRDPHNQAAENIREYLSSSIRPDAEYSSMAINLLKNE